MFKQFLTQLLVRFQRFMYGRYGNDELSRMLSYASLILLVASLFFRPLYILAYALLIWALFRTFSKNIAARQRERQTYLQLTKRVTSWWRLTKHRITDRKTHCFFKCEHCGAVIRVPKGRGTISVGCPRCKTRTTRHT